MLLALLAPMPRQPEIEAEALDELMATLNVPRSVGEAEGEIDTSTVEAERALILARDTQLWWYERFRRLCLMEDGAVRELSTVLRQREEDLSAQAATERDLRSQVETLTRAAAAAARNPVLAPALGRPPAIPSISERLGCLFAPE
jgi:hypothetical protein